MGVDIPKIDKKIESNYNIEQKDSSINNGGNTSYYDIPEHAKNVQDLIEHFGMNFAQGNILKAAYCLTSNRHNGTNYERELNKIIWFCKRELSRTKQN